MARKARIEFEEAVYHVLDRADRRESTVRDDADRERLLKTLGEACARTGWRVHAWEEHVGSERDTRCTKGVCSQ